MKRFVALIVSILVALLMLSLVACSGGKSEEKTELVNNVDRSNLELSALFNEVYLPFAKKEQSWSKDNIRAFLADTDYPYYFEGYPVDAIYVQENKHGYSDKVYFLFYGSLLTSSGVYYSQAHSRNEVYYVDNEDKKGYFVQKYLTEAVEVSSIEEQSSFLTGATIQATPQMTPTAKPTAEKSSNNHSDLFNDVYRHFAEQPETATYTEVVLHAGKMGYKFELQTDPVDTILIFDEAKGGVESVGFFYSIVDGDLQIMMINYANGQDYATWQNLSTDLDSSYDSFEVSKAGSVSTVDSVTGQRKILFGD